MPKEARNFGWPLVIVGGIFLVINFSILVAARSSLADLLVEFGVELSGLSSLAYSISKNAFALIAMLLGFGVGTSFVYSKMKSNRQQFSSSFFAVTTLIWLLFTFGFAFGILKPLYVVTTGLTD